MNTEYDLKDCTESYRNGWERADAFIRAGGDLNADGPPKASEETYNGFIDRLAKERRARSKVY